MMDLTDLKRDSQIRTTALVILTFIAVAVALYFLRPVLMPFVLALFIASGLVPLLNFVQGFLESSRPFAIFVTFFVSLGLTVFIWFVIYVSINQLSDAQKPYREGFTLMLERIEQVVDPFLPEPAKSVETPVKPSKEPTPSPQSQSQPQPQPEGSTVAASPLQPAAEESVALSPNRTDDALDGFASDDQIRESEKDTHRLVPFLVSRMNSVILLGVNELLTVLSSGLLVMIFLFFMLLGGSQVQLPENNIWRDVDAHVRKYIVAKTVISLVTGFIFGLVLWLFGVPLAFVLGMLAFLLNFIPNLGPIIASLLPVPLVWVLVEATWASEAYGANPEDIDPHMSLVKAIIVIVLAAAVQFTSGNVFEPKIMGDQFRLHPIAILLSLMFWYMIWGMVGAFLAVPITSALKVVFGELESTRPAADLLEGNLTILAKREPTSSTAEA